MSVYVRLFAAIDYKTRKMTVSMETIDPETGNYLFGKIYLDDQMKKTEIKILPPLE